MRGLYRTGRRILERSLTKISVVLISSLFAFGFASRADADMIEVDWSAVTVNVADPNNAECLCIIGSVSGCPYRKPCPAGS